MENQWSETHWASSYYREAQALRHQVMGFFLTTESQQSRKVEAKTAGASGWIVKPVTADELLGTIKLVMR